MLGMRVPSAPCVASLHRVHWPHCPSHLPLHTCDHTELPLHRHPGPHTRPHTVRSGVQVPWCTSISMGSHTAHSMQRCS